MKWLLLLLALNFPCSAFSQSVERIPKARQKAISLGTRQRDGRPGKNYWQNKADYDIRLHVHPPDRRIDGHEQITYFNNSPDILHHLQVRLIQNVHKPSARRDQQVDSGYFNTGIQIVQILLNGVKVTLTPAPGGHNGTWEILQLPVGLAPGDSTQVSVDWNYTLSDSRTTQPRDGVVDSTTFFLAYFYPRIDVFDDVNGWNTQDFTELQEFYNDFSDYRVTVSVPGNFKVWATGLLSDPDSVLGPAGQRELTHALETDSISTITGQEFPAGEERDWQFTAKGVTDFALGLSDHYIWKATGLEVDPTSGRRVLIQVAYPSGSSDFPHVPGVARSAIRFLSTVLPGMAFPYSRLTVFNGLSAMEYPMMVNDFSDPDFPDMESLTDHEISHTYFPFYMGTNESRYAFMDEGWAAFFELEGIRRQMGYPQGDSLFKGFYLSKYIHDVKSRACQPIMTPSGDLTGETYEYNSYGKPALAYEALKDLLGDSLFKACLRDYMGIWHGKHPQPLDFFMSFNTTSGQDLDWFWNNWFYSRARTGMRIQRVEFKGSTCRVLLKNGGGFAEPVDLRFHIPGQNDSVVHESPAIWKSGKHNWVSATLPEKPVSVSLDHGIFSQADEKGQKKGF